MILLDCGNSSFKARAYAAGQVRASFASAYGEHAGDRLDRWLADVDAERAVVCSVLDPARQAMIDRCLKRRFDDAVTRLCSEAEALGVTSGYDDPHSLGDDRWLALLGAAISTGRADCLIIDAGSAITIDLLRSDGQHLGGAILPGFNTSHERFREIFAYIDFDDPAIARGTEPGSSTAAAIQIDYDQPSIDRLPALVKRWTSYFQSTPQLLLAGGDAARVQGLLESPSRILSDLVFRGMLARVGA